MFKNFEKSLNCPYCEGKSYLLFKGKDYNRSVSDKDYCLYQCSKCSLQFVSNPPADLSIYYQDDYYSMHEKAEEFANIAKSQQFKVDLVNKFKTKGKLLEIGSAMGEFAYLSKMSGFDVTVIEMDTNCVEFMNKKLQIKAICSNNPAKALEDNNEKFDAICLWHSLEHMPEPWKVLDAATKHLNEDGILLVAVPNPESIQIKIMGKYWTHFDLPRHLFGLPIKWLRGYCEKNQLTPLLITTKDEGSIYWNRFSWAMIMRKLCLYKNARKKAKFWNKCLKYSKVFSLFEDREGKGATYTAILQKINQ